MMIPDELDFFDWDEFEAEVGGFADADLAYVKQEVMNHEVVWSIYTGIGEKIGQAASREVALVMASHNDLHPYSVH